MRRIVQSAMERLGLALHRWPAPNSLLKILAGTFERLGVDCVLDVGANTGQYAASLRRIGYRGWILSFEPVPENVARLEALARRDERWRVFPYALGGEDGEVILHVSERTDFSSVLTVNAYGVRTFAEAAEAAALVVPIHRLDTVFGGLLPGIERHRVFLKSDTQGYDLEVLHGAAGCAAGLVGVQVELSLKPIYDGMPSAAEVLRALDEAGFEPVGLAPVATDSAGALVEVDCVAQRRAGGGGHFKAHGERA